MKKMKSLAKNMLFILGAIIATQVFADQQTPAQNKHFELFANLLSPLVNPDDKANQEEAETAADQFISEAFLMPHPKGGVVFSDQKNHVIRYVDSLGKMHLLAGKYRQSGWQDGASSQSLFSSPAQLVFDQHQNLYVFDAGNYVIRKITPTGQVASVAGQPGRSGNRDGLKQGALLSKDIFGMFFDRELQTLILANYENRPLDEGALFWVKHVKLSGLVESPQQDKLSISFASIEKKYHDSPKPYGQSDIVLFQHQSGRYIAVIDGVLYDCTDDQLNAFNIALLSRHTLSMGKENSGMNAPAVDMSDHIDTTPIQRKPIAKKKTKKIYAKSKLYQAKKKTIVKNVVSEEKEESESNADIPKWSGSSSYLAWNATHNMLFILDTAKRRIVGYNTTTKIAKILIEDIPEGSIGLVFFDGHLHVLMQEGELLRYRGTL